MYIYKDRRWASEIIFSLRSLECIADLGQVHIYGEPPQWVNRLRAVPVPQHKSSMAKHPNALANLRAAIADPAVSDEFWLFNDDFFVTRPVETLPVLNWGKVDTVLGGHGRGWLGGTYHKSMIWTRELCRTLGIDDPISYQLHAPLLIRKQQFLATMDLVDAFSPELGVWPHYATVYGNLYNLGGVSQPYDVKIMRKGDDIPEHLAGSVYLSTSNPAWPGVAGSRIRAMFPNPSRFEDTDDILLRHIIKRSQLTDQRLAVVRTKLLQ